MSTDFTDLLRRLLECRTPQQLARLLESMGDSPNLDLGQELGSSGLKWLPFGGDASNLSAINLAAKPGRSLTERITNAEDALLELRASRTKGELPLNPRQATQQWFGRPVSGPDSGLYSWDYATDRDDRHIAVVLQDCGRTESATIDVIDAGMGIDAAHFPKTILSLRGGNKISKFYLIGAFGQGGSSTLGFSDFALYASRHVDSPHMAAFTVVRVLTLGDSYKEDCYGFLGFIDAAGEAQVPAALVGNGPVALYGPAMPKAPRWTHGTVVRHIGFQLPGLAGSLQASPGNLYHFLHASMFDPLLPFRLVDLREPGKMKDELVSGTRNRLMKYTTKAKGDEAEDGAGELHHYRPMEFVAPHGESDPSIGIEYWVVLNWRKGKGKDRVLRPASNELFVQRNHPIVGTLNGQNQGELTAALIRRANLALVSKHIVVHVDASRAPSHVRRQLFSSTREGFKEGTILSAIEAVLGRMLSEDEDLAKLERELAERVVQKDSAQTEEEVKRQITRLLQDSGMKVSESGPTVAAGEGEQAVVPRKKGAAFKRKAPLPTLPYPQVTKWQIVAPTTALEVHIDDYEVVLVETDADAEFDRRGLIAVRCEPPLLEVGTKAPLSGGRVRWRMRTIDTAAEGQSGKLFAVITRPDGTQLTAQIPFNIKARLPEPTRKAKGQVPPFDVLPIDPRKEEDREQWGSLWPELESEEDEEKLATVAYKTTTAGGRRIVYFNVLFPPFRLEEEKYLRESRALAAAYRIQYKIWIGYHALLQEQDSSDERAEDGTDLVERTLREETLRVATMQAKQARQFVELKKLATLAAEGEGSQ